MFDQQELAYLNLGDYLRDRQGSWQRHESWAMNSASQQICVWLLMPLFKFVRSCFTFEVGDHSLKSGLSVLPPPATIPIIPRALLWITFFAPLGSLTLVFPSSGLCPMTVT